MAGPVALSSTIAAGGTVGSTGGQMIFNQENALGSTIATRSATGALGGIWEYDAYGNEKSQNVTLQTDLRFAGKHGYISDPDTGFDLLGARYYIPRLGRFLTQDPIGQKGGLNLYAYCENNPLLKVDPDGREGVNIFGFEFSGEVWGKGLGTSGAALLTNLSFGAYDGGAYKYEPGFNESRLAWSIAEMAGTGAVGASRTIAKNTVYYGFKNGEMVYVGRTINLGQRAKQHGDRFDYLLAVGKNLTKNEARALEQAVIEKYGMKKFGGQLLNKRNEIAKTRDLYKKVDSFRRRVK